jgi:hypothetical protein
VFLFHFQQGVFCILTLCDVPVCAGLISVFLQQVQCLTVAEQKEKILPKITIATCKEITCSVVRKEV